MTNALFLSPHLDDVAFSCAGTLARFQESGWQTRVVTIFTGSVLHPEGFALACQLDKGLAADVDYMKLRRAEDDEFSRLFNVNPEHWPLLEAPHRGYNSAPDLFAGIHDGDEIWRDVAARLQVLGEPDVVFAPQGLGNHVDHLQVIRAVLEMGWAAKTMWYRDTPYAIRQPDARPSELLPRGLEERAVGIGKYLERKIVGAQAYASQIGFQFGGAEPLAAKLREFHALEAERAGLGAHHFAERFLAAPEFSFSL
jgi:LmbE family N-acetylglucosaminyl deacetylase